MGYVRPRSGRHSIRQCHDDRGDYEQRSARRGEPSIYITGGDYGVPLGDMRTVGYVYLPEGFDLVDATLSESAGFGGGMHDGRRVLSFAVELSPGESATATITAAAPAGSPARLEVYSTPTLVASPTVAAMCEGS